MKKKSLNFIEVHVEKFVLGLTGAFLLFMLWMYLINSPNKVKYGGRELGPRELNEEILRGAGELDRAIAQNDPPEVKIEKYADRLEQQHMAGLFVAGNVAQTPPPPANLRLAATFGKRIEVPGLEEEEEQVGSIALVTPLKPSPPVLRTGRSKVVKSQIVLGGDQEAPTRDQDENIESAATEVAWVSIAAYFDSKTQRNEMTKAGYAPFRANPYVVGVDAQRQEMLASGEWADWEVAPPTQATPQLDIPTPAFDDQDGSMVNREDITQAFHVVKEAQATLMQPPFYEVEAGEDWLSPFEVEEDEDDEGDDDAAARRRRQREERLERQARARQSGGGGGGRVVGGGRGGMRGGGGDIMIGGGAIRGGGMSGGSGGDRSRRADAAREKREGQKRAREELRDAFRTYKEKDYGQAQQLANRVLNNEFTSKGDLRKAEKLLDAVEKRLNKERRDRGAGAGAVGRFGQETIMTGNEGMMGARGMIGARGRVGGGRMRAADSRAASREPTELLRHPENNRPAVWFHDDSVESGKTYRYRMRVRLWNRYVGRLRPLRNPQDAREPVLIGEWSLPSDPITVTPSSYFFVRGPRAGKEAANVEVWKWREGDWIKETFDVEVGDVIGDVRKVKLDEWDEDGKEIRADVDFATGAVVLDLRFDEPVTQRVPAGKSGFSHNEKTSLVIVYLDPADGQVKEKVALFDRYDRTKRRLEDGL